MYIFECNEYEDDIQRFRVEEMILGMANIVYENRRLRCELEEAKKFEKKYNDLLNESVDNANKHTAGLLEAIIAGAFTQKAD